MSLAESFLLYAAIGFILGLMTLRKVGDAIEAWEKPFILISIVMMWPLVLLRRIYI